MGWNDYESKQVRALRGISTRSEKPNKDLETNIRNLNNSVRYMSSMMGIMQEGIDDANRDILQQFEDAIQDLMIIFNIGGGGDTLNLDWGDIGVVLENISSILRFDFLNLPDFDLLGWAQDVWDSVFNPLNLIPSWDDLRKTFIGAYAGDNIVLNFIQNLFAPIRRVVKMFTGKALWEDATAAEVDQFSDDLKAALSGGTPSSGGQLNGANAIQQIANNINALGEGVAEGVEGAIQNVHTVIGNIFGTADSAEKIAMAAQQQLQDITNETNVPGWSGYSWSTIFSGADGTPLPSTDWATTRITIVGDDGHAGIINNSADGDHFCTVRDIHKFATDSQSASIVVRKKWSFSEDRWTSIRLRCDSENPTQGAVCWVRPGNIRIGRFSGSTNTVWYTVGQTIKAGDIVRFRCHGDNYYVLVNGKVVVSWTDTTASVSKGAGFRHAAFTQEYLNGAFFDQASFQVASWAMADWLPPGGTVTTPSWRLRRSSGGRAELSVSSGSVAQMPAGFYTVSDVSSGVTVSSLGVGEVTIGETGWYEVSASSTSTDTSDLSSDVGTQDYLAGAFRPSLWVLYIDGSATIGPVMAGVSVTVYLAAGQSIQPGVSASWPMILSGASGTRDSRATITHVSGAPAASFIGRKVS